MWWARLLNSVVALLGDGSSSSASSFESIATVTGNGSASTLTFSSIPSSYKHLQIRGIYRDTASGTFINTVRFTFNSDSGANYSYHWLRGDGSSVTAGGGGSSTIQLGGRFPYNGNTANVYGAIILNIQDYASTTKNKTTRAFGGTDINGTGQIDLGSDAWYSTSVINSVTLTANGTAFDTASTFALYGIKG